MDVKEKIQLDVALASPVLLANQLQTVYLRIGLTGFQRQEPEEPLVPLNVALLIDTSESMLGVKLSKAKQAAMMMVSRLRPIDTIAIVSHDHRGKILLPSTKVKDPEMINERIQTLRAKGQMALLDGLKKGTKEIRKSLQPDQINRIILVSDRLTNVGPNSLSEISEFGRSLAEKNMTITTIAFGMDYDQSLIMELSQPGHNNYVLVENTIDMTRAFEQEFLNMASVVAQEIEVMVNCSENVRPLEVFGLEAKIEEQIISVRLNQLDAEQEKYVLVELEIPPMENQRKKQQVAEVAVVYRNLKTRRRQTLKERVTATFTDSELVVTENINTTVMIAAAEQLAMERNKLARQLRDQGKIQEAKQLLLKNAFFLAEEAAKYNAPFFNDE